MLSHVLFLQKFEPGWFTCLEIKIGIYGGKREFHTFFEVRCQVLISSVLKAASAIQWRPFGMFVAFQAMQSQDQWTRSTARARWYSDVRKSVCKHCVVGRIRNSLTFRSPLTGTLLIPVFISQENFLVKRSIYVQQSTVIHRLMLHWNQGCSGIGQKYTRSILDVN
jgi:hypothetical protein